MKRACLLLAVAAACTDADELPAPTITSITPEATCFPGQLRTVSIVGSNFVDGSELVFEETGGSNRIDVIGNAVSTFSSSLIVAIVDPGAGAPAALEPPHVYDVVVRNPDNQEARLPAAFTKYANLAISSVSPAVGARGTQVAVTIQGDGFYDEVGVRLGVGPQVLTEWVPATSKTSLSMTFDLAGINSGSYAVVVENRGGCTLGLDNAFLVE